MSVKVKVNSNGNLTNGKVLARKKTHLPTQKDIAEMYKDEVITPEEEEIIEVSIRVMKAMNEEEKRQKRSESQRNSIKRTRRLPTQKDFVLPKKLSPQDEKLIDVSMRAIEALKREIKRGTFR